MPVRISMARRPSAAQSTAAREVKALDGGGAGDPQNELIHNTTKIVSSFVANNSLPASELPGLIKSVADTFRNLETTESVPEPKKPAVPVKKSVQPDYIICLEDGKKLKMLKRHLRTAYDMSPDEYRERWGLASNYPMVAPNYAKQRSKLAKKIGLGRR